MKGGGREMSERGGIDVLSLRCKFWNNASVLQQQHCGGRPSMNASKVAAIGSIKNDTDVQEIAFKISSHMFVLFLWF